eukprot:COSAG01_NODE_4179_length_5265_cov_15.857917_2_plen_95_part_00
MCGHSTAYSTQHSTAQHSVVVAVRRRGPPVRLICLSEVAAGGEEWGHALAEGGRWPTYLCTTAVHSTMYGTTYVVVVDVPRTSTTRQAAGAKQH